MSKFIKIGMIAGILMILVGTGVAAVSVAMGVSVHRLADLFREREIFISYEDDHGVREENTGEEDGLLIGYADMDTAKMDQNLGFFIVKTGADGKIRVLNQ